ncbi:hypothetical protein DLAC_11378 [Tieghemostelium lacteum]|uniref:Uncharacterized protein n=1 Tax=Tieghemostelium lacteum TaxID=361077 RepID=A0A151Z3T6_TIELA|nr:hypothetical protein DLAC_11378 [Tieghemostelium lacteum]|eukprot:KYQ88632.1 hypothetical protein DLAC_11378 [Tieghemostelium lacteum]
MSPRPESIKKAIEVLGDFNPSEDKLKKTLGIGEDEIRQIQEEKTIISSSAKDRIPMNKKETRKAQNTLGINLSKEKLMDVLGVDEPTITEAQCEEVEHQEKQIKRFREHLIISNKRALKKGLEKMGCDPSSSKIMRLLGVSQVELNSGSSGTNSNIKDSSSDLHSFLISLEITIFMLLFYAVLYYFKII